VNTVRRKIVDILRFKWLPWILVGVTLAVALFHEIVQPPWISDISRQSQTTFWALSLVGLVLAYLVAERFLLLVDQRSQMQQRVELAERFVAEASQRLDAIFRLSQKFVEASDENEIVELVLRLAVDMVGASGASYVPLDERGQPLAAISHGELPFPVVNDWVEYLATPAVRGRCKTCESHGSLNTSQTCPLLKGPFSDAIGLYCLPLRSGEREFGVLNLYMPNQEKLDTEAQAFLRALMDETALALDGVRLRRRELAALRQMQAVREKMDLEALLTSLLEDVHQSLESDFAMLVVREVNGSLSRVRVGELPSPTQPFLEGVMQGVMASAEPVMLGDVAGDPPSEPGAKSILAAPLIASDGTVIGVLLVGNRRIEGFQQRQLALLQTVAGQVVLIVQNANLMAELEYKTLIQERTRLAREIHDGLAQTLGFLKLQVAQMQNYLERNEIERLHKSVDLCYATLSDAYQDVRQAIDGLRIGPSGNSLQGWLEQTIEEFQEISELAVDLDEMDVQTELPPEIHAQLIRIVQEALSNIRKHAQAENVWINCREFEGDLWLEIRDDGVGFSPEDVPKPSRHGLKGMRERAELIGADFQVISCNQEGTTIRLRLPLFSVNRFQTGEINK